MSNAFYDGNWVLDTASTTAPLLGVTNDIRVAGWKWIPNAAGDDLVIKDGDGDTKVVEKALAGGAAGKEVKTYPSDRPIVFHKGMVLHTLDGGTLYVDLA